MIRLSAENKISDEEQAVAAHNACVRGAWIAAVFCLLVLGLMMGNRVAMQKLDPMTNPQLASLNKALIKDPKNDELKTRVRRLDKRLRREYLKSLDYDHTGGYVLLVGVGLFLIAGASAAAYKKKLPVVDSPEESADESRKSSLLARRAVTIAGGVMAFGLVALAVSSQGNLNAQYLKATKGYVRPVAESKESADSAPAAASAPNAPPAVQPGPAAPPSGANPGPGVLPKVGPLPLPGNLAVQKTGTQTQNTPAANQDSSEKSKPKPAEIKTVALDASDYKPSPEEWAKNWPVFRGPSGSGFVDNGNYPVKWDGASGDGILWKIAIDLPGWNSPVVWDDSVFLSGADKDKRAVYCVGASSGKVVWSQTAKMLASQVNVMEDTGYAPSSLAADGKRVFAIFPNGDLYCFDFDGKELWSKNLGEQENIYGYASSLTMLGSLLMVLYDRGSGSDGKSLLMALQGGTGDCVWYARRDVPNSWATPIVVNAGSRMELITSANPWVISYDPLTGKEYWRANLMTGDVAPSPIFAGGFIMACNTGAVLGAVKAGGSGDVTKSHVAWKSSDNLPDISSPAANSELVFMADSMGNATCVDIKTGAKVWEHTFSTAFKASPTIVGKRVYLLDNDGVMHIVGASRSFNEEAACKLSEGAAATPAFISGRIYIRGVKNLYCIGKK